MFIMSEQTSINRARLKEVILEQKHEFKELPRGVKREKLARLVTQFDSNHINIIKGVRRCGKSTLLAQLVDQLDLQKVNYLNFEDERLLAFAVTDFNLLVEVFHEINGGEPIYFFDEIQVVDNWERFARRMHNGGKKLVLTGSNASLLSQELGTKLTGRHIDLELFPFSYPEFLLYKNYEFSESDLFITEKRGELYRHFNDYLFSGGFPTYLDNPLRETLTGLYEDIIIRDVLQRHKIDNTKTFREIAFFLTTNCTSSISYQNLKEYFKLGSVNTVIKYIGYLENSYFLFAINPFSPSFKKQVNAPKKVYIISNAFVDKIGFNIGNKGGVLLENLVFLHLKQVYENIYYYKTKNGLEVDFLVYNESDSAQLIQVSWSIEDSKTRKREVNAIVKASQETSINTCWVLTQFEKETITVGDLKIEVIPVYEWILTKMNEV